MCEAGYLWFLACVSAWQPRFYIRHFDPLNFLFTQILKIVSPVVLIEAYTHAERLLKEKYFLNNKYTANPLLACSFNDMIFRERIRKQPSRVHPGEIPDPLFVFTRLN